MKRFFLLVLFLSSPLAAQTVDDSLALRDSSQVAFIAADDAHTLRAFPFSRYGFDRLQWSLTAADFGVRAFDAYSTERSLRNPRNHEDILPDWISHVSGRAYAYSEIVAVANLYLSRELVRHHHTRLAKLVPALDIALDGEAAVHNMTLATAPENRPLLVRGRH